MQIEGIYNDVRVDMSSPAVTSVESLLDSLSRLLLALDSVEVPHCCCLIESLTMLYYPYCLFELLTHPGCL